jgi:Fe-S-cluster containining protein
MQLNSSDLFECSKCGNCCRSLNFSNELKHLNRGEGVCINFNERDNLCSIFEDRPILCNVEKAFAMVYSHNMSRSDYIRKNIDVCNFLKISKE